MKTLTKQDTEKLFQLLGQLTFQMRDDEGEIKTCGQTVETQVAWKSIRTAQTALYNMLLVQADNPGYSLVRCPDTHLWALRYFRAGTEQDEGNHTEWPLTSFCSVFLSRWTDEKNTPEQLVKLEAAIRAELAESIDDLNTDSIVLPKSFDPDFGACDDCGEIGPYAALEDASRLKLCEGCYNCGADYGDSYTRGMEGGYCDL